MLANQIPAFDAADNETNCCPRFKPQPWMDKELHFDNKLFVRAYGKTYVVGVAKVSPRAS